MGATAKAGRHTLSQGAVQPSTVREIGSTRHLLGCSGVGMA